MTIIKNYYLEIFFAPAYVILAILFLIKGDYNSTVWMALVLAWLFLASYSLRGWKRALDGWKKALEELEN